MQITYKQLGIIQDALWSRMKKHGQITKKDSAAMKTIGNVVELRTVKDGE